MNNVNTLKHHKSKQKRVYTIESVIRGLIPMISLVLKVAIFITLVILVFTLGQMEHPINFMARLGTSLIQILFGYAIFYLFKDGFIDAFYNIWDTLTYTGDDDEYYD